MGKEKSPDPEEDVPQNEWEKIFATYVTDKTLYPEYLKSSCKAITEQQETEEKQARHWPAFRKEETQTAIRLKGMCPTSWQAGRCALNHSESRHRRQMGKGTLWTRPGGGERELADAGCKSMRSLWETF